ncbi:MAG: PDZ domain-containing protein, partial [Planctomycetes bacterium]|nr:PDZ domain-containing protein [Planctomycetota bacterium]
MVRAPEQLREAAAPYVAVRVTDMKNVDTTAIAFDFDLTMAVLLMHPDGTVYHRYGSRPADDPTAWTSLAGLCDLLDATVEEHEAKLRVDRARGAGEAPLPKWTPAIEQPALRGFLDDRQRPDCIHCHTIHDSQQHFARAQGTWRDEQRWIHPEPARVGLTLDPADQARITAVAADSPAAAAGLRADDRIVSIGRQRSVRTIAD